jgi:hypothetical protein
MPAESLQSELEGYAVGAVLFLIVVGAFLWGAASFATYRCAERWEGRNTRFSAVAGCLVEQDGAFVPEMAGR